MNIALYIAVTLTGVLIIFFGVLALDGFNRLFKKWRNGKK